MVFAICMMLAAVHGLLWFRQRKALASLAFALLALSTGLISATELRMMRAETPVVFETVLRWYQVFVCTGFFGLVGFLHFYLKTGRPWLGLLTCMTRTLTLVPNFTGAANLNFREITAIPAIPFLGEIVRVPVGTPNPWMLLGQISLVMLIAYITDASIRSWRQGNRRGALMVGGSLDLFILLGFIQAILVFWGLLPMPITTSFFFLVMLVVMAYELSRDLLRAAELVRELERERAITDAIFDGVPGLIYVYTEHGQLIRWNRRVEQESGYSSRELANISFASWFDGTDVEAVRKEWTSTLASGQGRLETHLAMKGGRKVPYLLTAVRVEIDGKPHLVGIGIDISEQTRMESELQHRRRELAHMNRVSTMGVLAASLAHELNQPLAASVSNASAAVRMLAAPQPDLAEISNILNDISEQNMRAGGVLKSLRVLISQSSPGEQVIDVNNVIAPVVQLVRGECIARRVDLRYRSLDKTAPAVKGDAVQLQQVILNLVMNAIDAVETKPPRERIVQITSSRRHRGIVRITVQDHGPGIAADRLEKIFEPFITTKQHGMGMGLSVCREIVHAHGGQITAANQSTGGAIITIELPSARDNDTIVPGS